MIAELCKSGWLMRVRRESLYAEALVESANSDSTAQAA